MTHSVKLTPVLCVVAALGASSLQAGKNVNDHSVLDDMSAGFLGLELAGDTGAANRIVAGDMLRSLSQEIPAAVCHLHNNVDVEEAAHLLEHSIEAFDIAADALLHGNEALGIIGAEARRKTIVELEELIAAWEPVHDAALQVLHEPADIDAVRVVYASADVMYEKTYHLLANLEGEYSNPSEVLAADVMLLEIVGRMAATNQRLAYDACMVWSHSSDDAHYAAELLESMSIYENSLTALTVGMPALGIAPPPTEEIAQKLHEIGDHWSDVHDMLLHVTTGEEIPDQERFDIYHELAVKLHAIEELEVLYQNYSKRIY